MIFSRVLGLFTLASTLALIGVTSPRLEPDPAAIRILSFNVRYGTADDGPDSWPYRRELVMQLLEAERPDVTGLQEALRFQLDELRGKLRAFAEVGVGRDDGENEGEYAAILFREDRFELIEQGTFWFSDTPGVPGSRSWGNRIPRICTWAHLRMKTDGSEFLVFNLHLDHQSHESRLASVEFLADKVRERAGALPVVITGDFNAGELDPAIQFLQGVAFKGAKAAPLRLTDTFRAVHPEAKAAGTFNGFQGIRTGDKIDFVFVSPGFQVLQAEVVRTSFGGRYPSDHFPVSADVVLTPKR